MLYYYNVRHHIIHTAIGMVATIINVIVTPVGGEYPGKTPNLWSF